MGYSEMTVVPGEFIKRLWGAKKIRAKGSDPVIDVA